MRRLCVILCKVGTRGVLFFFKQKTAYDMRISDWSSDVCSSDLPEEIKRLLPFVLLLDVLDEGRHFRFRLVGTDAASGIDPTGKLLHEAAPGGVYLNHLSALFSRGAAGPGDRKSTRLNSSH